ncbi:hypothetical protein ACHAXA_008100 [Cyclostephanos tholiformis]|uniref:PPIase cyclophilin-type domain-containing protein n=1 Tax=Cyclostephanos tholiformis TaxID=382380 RepID=A0ABD3RVR3_9STRA
MSAVYSTEPGTTGRVVIDTTHGPIDIHLWCKECPTTTRTFLQLCIDGYYDGMIFHRILSDFLVQTGLTRDGNRLSGLEVNPRIRFNHRGQVAMAFPLDGGGGGSAGDANHDGAAEGEGEEEERAMLRYQFFITLDEAPFLDAKHVVFGTVSGPTVFNALRIGRTDADEVTGVPTDVLYAPPRIRGVRVDHHPFGDMVVTPDANIPWRKKRGDGASGEGGGEDGGEQSEMERRRKKRKGKRDLNVLSFGEEERDYEEIVAGDNNIRGGGSSMSSARDLSSGENQMRKKTKDRIVEEDNPKIDANEKLSQMGKKKSSLETESSINVSDLRATREHSNEGSNARPENSGIVPEAGKIEPKIECINPKDDQYVVSSKKSNSLSGVGVVELRRNKYLRAGMGSSASKNERLKREGDTMARLFAFKNKMLEARVCGKDGISNDGARNTPTDDSLASRMANRVKRTEDEEQQRRRKEEALMAMPGYSGRVNADQGSDDGSPEDWMGTRFKCKRHMDQDSRMTALDGIVMGDVGGDGRRMEDYVVLDEKRRGTGGESNRRGRHRNNGREHGGHHTGSRKHAGRSLKRDGHHRPTT